MSKYPALAFLTLLAASQTWGSDAAAKSAARRTELWYRQPAAQWVEALPVGNGRLGAMVFGGVAHERIQFNESSVWTGEPHSYAHPGAYRVLPQLRELLFQGKQKEAQELAMREFMSIPLTQKAYQAFGDLVLDFPGTQDAGASAYRRDLDLDTATASVEYVEHGVTYRREVFSSWPDQVIVVRISASKPGSVSFSAGLKSAHEGAALSALPGGDVSMSGAVASSAIRFEARLHVAISGGRRETRDGQIVVSGADSATLLLAGATNFKNYQDVSADPKERNAAVLVAASKKAYPQLQAPHQADHQRLFRRVTLNLGGDLGTTPAASLPTDERIRAFRTGNDPELVSLLFQYGRYLLIASSREGGEPATLQGLWNDSNTPPWDSKYTCNINTEMNYWPAEVTNLAECHRPLFDALKELAASGAVTAKEHYNARGWVLHHNFDLWRGTAPINASDHGIWQSGGAWLAQHLWEHYLYSEDKEFLRTTAYPILRGSALFFVDSLVQHPANGWLVTGPSNSPEQGGLVMGPTMDHEIVRGVFGAVIAASQILDTDAELRQQLVDMRARIAPDQIGKYGQLQEWIEDKDNIHDQHRHVSHLWGVYPGGEITPGGTPELFAAARKSLEYRGDAATGWSMGWKINLWARFLDGDHAYKILQNLLQPSSDGNKIEYFGGAAKTASKPAAPAEPHAGVYPNLFDAHPPFQIDGNFGATAGIAEMLLQSNDPQANPTSLTDTQQGQAAIVRLLPALPSAFPAGSVTGLRARGGFEVDIAWRHGKLQRATLRAKASGPLTLIYADRKAEIAAVAGRQYVFDTDLKPVAK